MRDRATRTFLSQTTHVICSVCIAESANISIKSVTQTCQHHNTVASVKFATQMLKSSNYSISSLPFNRVLLSWFTYSNFHRWYHFLNMKGDIGIAGHEQQRKHKAVHESFAFLVIHVTCVSWTNDGRTCTSDFPCGVSKVLGSPTPLFIGCLPNMIVCTVL